jgi:deoxyribonucleoside regulator
MRQNVRMANAKDEHVFTDETSAEVRGRLDLLLSVARMYYLENRSQDEIATSIGYSRPTVSRMLAEARDRRMVTITVSHPLEQVLDLERRLTRRFGLDLALVAGQSSGTPVVNVGRVAAQALVDHGNPRTLVALSNGTSLAAVVDAVPQQRWPFSCVTQMIGSLGVPDRELVDSPDLCRRLAAKLGGTYRPMPVPIVLTSAAVARSVRHEEIVVSTFELAARADVALVGVGAVGPDGTSGAILRHYLTDSIRAEVRKGRAVAHICGHHFDAAGRHVRTSLCDRMICMAPERLADIKLSLAVAWGHEKVPALHAVLKADLVSGLATDEATARELLAYEP